MAIYKGDTEYTDASALLGDVDLAGIYYGSNAVIDLPTSRFAHVQYAGTDAVGIEIFTNHDSTLTYHFRHNTASPFGYDVWPDVCYNTNGAFSTFDRSYTYVDSSTHKLYDGKYVVEFNDRNVVLGTSSYWNSSTYDNHNIFSFRYDGEYLLDGGTLTNCKGFNAPGNGVQHLVYQGNGTGGATFEHGCGATPTFYIIKGLASSRSPLFGGPIFGQANGTGDNTYAGWDSSGAPGSDTFCFASFDATNVTLGSSVFQDWNSNGSYYHVQLFYDVPGVCASGVINAAGGSVHTETLGFEPALVIMVEPAASGHRYWLLQDGQTTGPAMEFYGIAGGDDGGTKGSTRFEMTATGFTIADGEKGNDGSSSLAYVALVKG